MFKYMILILSFGVFSNGKSQIEYKHLINKWKIIMYEEANGDKYPVPKEEQSEHFKFNSDSTIESIEEGTLIKGTWSLNLTTNTLTIRQAQSKGLLSEVISKIIKLTPTELVLEAIDPGGDKLIIYAVPY